MPDDIALDQVIHRWSPRRALAALLVLSLAAAVIAVAVMSLIGLLIGHRTSEGGSVAVFLIGYPVAFTVFSLIGEIRRPGELEFRAGGIALTAPRRDGAFLPWPAVTGLRVRWFWPLTSFSVTIAAVDQAQVVTLHRDRRAPARRRRGDTIHYAIPVAALDVSAAALRAEAARRGFPAN
jgi:hypothetical protein